MDEKRGLGKNRRSDHSGGKRLFCAALLILLGCAGCFSRIEGRVNAYGPAMGLSKIVINQNAVPDGILIFFEDLDRRIEKNIWVMPGERQVTVCFAFDETRKELDRRALIEVAGLPTQIGQVNRLQVKANIKYQKDYHVSFIFSRQERSDGRTVFKFDDIRLVEAKAQ